MLLTGLIAVCVAWHATQLPWRRDAIAETITVATAEWPYGYWSIWLIQWRNCPNNNQHQCYHQSYQSYKTTNVKCVTDGGLGKQKTEHGVWPTARVIHAGGGSRTTLVADTQPRIDVIVRRHHVCRQTLHVRAKPWMLADFQLHTVTARQKQTYTCVCLVYSHWHHQLKTGGVCYIITIIIMWLVE